MKNKWNNWIFVLLTIFVLTVATTLTINMVKANADSSSAEKVYGKPKSELSPSTAKLLSDKNYGNIILPDALTTKINEKGKVFVYYFSPTCGHCKFTTPKLVPIVDELGIKMYKLNLLESPKVAGERNIEYTPTLVFYEKGVEVSRMVGGLRENEIAQGYFEQDYKDFLQKYNK